MNRKLLFPIFMLLSLSAVAQNWSGSTPGSIYYTSGNVGIGINNPGTKLDVRGNIRFSGATNGSTGIGDGFTHFSHADGNNYIRGNTYIQTSGIVKINAEGKTVITGGNVGIGTESPTERLEIAGKIKMYGQPSPRWDNSISGYVLESSHFYGHTDTEAIYLGEAGNTVGIRGKLGVGIGAPGTSLDVRGNIRFTGAANGSEGMGDGFTHFNHNNGNNYIRGNTYIATTGIVEIYTGTKTLLSGGNVGIGTSSPDAALAVKGQIHTQEVKVDLNGAVAPDYVFHKDYPLKKVQEVETYINANGHLPNVPSAEEMEENGIELKEMNLKLLEKVEELTLYIIEQNKQIKALEEKNKAQDQLLQELINNK